ncbi:hypothetical protein F2Q69_00040193 [Brassica cretica]|uniref:Uncharacterized protein n=1 Tax=Brassica cretica TaxID=69181 RepID=A0A8S9NFP0_BRACR|nr:hypothetical protein F2Q69_00040193 [Brassica cretica]
MYTCLDENQPSSSGNQRSDMTESEREAGEQRSTKPQIKEKRKNPDKEPAKAVLKKPPPPGDKNWRSFSDLENFWDDLPVSRLKYNALDDFHEVFPTTSKKTSWSSRRLPGSLPDDFQEVFQTTSWKSSDEVFFHIKWSPSLSL